MQLDKAGRALRYSGRGGGSKYAGKCSENAEGLRDRDGTLHT